MRKAKKTLTPFGIITEKIKALNHEMDELKVDVRKINTNKEKKSLHKEIKSIRTSEFSYDKSYLKPNIHPTNLKDTFEHYLKESCKRQDVLNEWMKKFMIKTEMNLKDHDSPIKRLEENVNHLAQLLSTHNLTNHECAIKLSEIPTLKVETFAKKLKKKTQEASFYLALLAPPLNPKPINMVIELADKSMQSLKGIVENVMVTSGLMMKKRKGSDSLCPVDKKKDIVKSMGDSESLISNLECHYSSEDYVRIKKRCCKEDVACSVEGVSGLRKIAASAMPCATSSVVLNRRGIKRKIGCIDVGTQMGRKNKFVDDYITGDSIGKGKFGSLCLCRCRARGVEFAC
nr:serine/threonine-protein kinase PEPKR2 [Tanacetum cinerariifolium]